MAKFKGFRAVYVGTGKVHLTAQEKDSPWTGSLCDRMASGRGHKFFVTFDPETGCKHCAKEAERRSR